MKIRALVRALSLIVVAILAGTLVQGGAEPVQSAPAANSQCVAPTPPIFNPNPFAAQIDVKPGNAKNNINIEKEGVVSIAICSDDADGKPPQAPGEFNAPNQVIVICNNPAIPPFPQPSSNSCRNLNVPATPAAGLLPGTPTAGRNGFEFSLHSCHGERDINGDGAKDLVCHFYVNRMNLGPTSTLPASTTITVRGCCKTPEFEGTNAINCEADCPPSFPPTDY